MSGSEITHKLVDGHYVQVCSPATLRKVLDAQGDSYARPDDFGPADEWNVAGVDACEACQ